jgi:uncharacterized protein YbbK (DUF523 family)
LGSQRPAVLVSACLLGVACNHRGEGNSSPIVEALARRARLIPVCPEVAGGLPTPRPAAEVALDGSVRTAAGDQVTDAYRQGAAHAVAVAQAAGVVGAVLKARSPSCGCHEVYDGSHQRVLRQGQGVAAAALSAAGIAVCSEEDLVDGALPWTGPGA